MKDILLTGAKGGIGAAIESTLTQQGMRILAIDRDTADVSSPEDIQTLKQKIGEAGKLDWIVCAHGFIDSETDLEKQKPSDIEETFKVNSLSLFYLAQALTPLLSPGGGMIVLSSTAGLFPNGRYSAYSASKAAANAFVQALARSKPEFTFISICPGPTNTSMREKIGGDRSKAQDPQVIADVIQKIIAGETNYVSGDILIVRDGETSVASRLE